LAFAAKQFQLDDGYAEFRGGGRVGDGQVDGAAA
jgi:hypothetical protein